LGFEPRLCYGALMGTSSDRHPLDHLFAIIAARKAAGDSSESYTARLLAEGVEKCAKKVGEEAVETALAAVLGNKEHLAAESADLLYHLLVLWAAAGITPDEVYAALKKREGRSGLAEKASRNSRS
jgi:phosphoribosyl-ATP pyrophosphohydrolase